MQAQEIEANLAALGLELQDLGAQNPVRILMVGGAFMITQFHNRHATNDVDIVLKDIIDPYNSSLYPPFKTAVRAIAKQKKIPVSWINDVIGDFLRDASVVPEGTLWRVYGKLEIYLPPAEYILALKLLAGRQKDENDIQTLCQYCQIQTMDQAQQLVDRYIPDKQTQQLNNVSKTLANIFP